jgi:signal peptidase II
MTLPDSISFSSANKYLLRLSLISVSVFVLDQVTKQIALTHLATLERLPVWGTFLQFTLVFNEGGAFSSRLGSALFYAIAAIIVMAFVISFLYKEAGKNKILDFALSLVIGGALGNLIDRTRFGSVVDFVDIDFPDIHIAPFKFLFVNFPGYELLRWPVFNVADSAISVGMVLVIAVLLFSRKKKSECQLSAQ